MGNGRTAQINRINDAKQALAKPKAERVVALRIQGYSFADIARKVGFENASGAWKAFQHAIHEVPVPNAEEAREEELEDLLVRKRRLNRTLKRVGHDPQAIAALDRQLNQIAIRRAALLGLDAPAITETKVTVSAATPAGARRVMSELFGSVGDGASSGSSDDDELDTADGAAASDAPKPVDGG